MNSEKTLKLQFDYLNILDIFTCINIHTHHSPASFAFIMCFSSSPSKHLAIPTPSLLNWSESGQNSLNDGVWTWQIELWELTFGQEHRYGFRSRFLFSINNMSQMNDKISLHRSFPVWETYLQWFEWEMSPIVSWIWTHGPQLMVLFRKV